MLVLLVGLFLGLVFLLGGLSGAVSRIQMGLQTMRMRRRGITVDAEVLSRRMLADKAGDAPSEFLVTGQWLWGEAQYQGEFTVPERWWESSGGLSSVRIDPKRPHLAVVESGLINPVRELLLASVWFIMAVVGLFFLFRSVTVACDQVRYDSLEPICESLRGAFT
jgi:hypothetical protein